MRIAMPLEKYRFVLLLFFLLILFSVLSFLSHISYGGADDIVHYRFARYSFQHPELLLDHWAKPFFTLLASPFAQLGYWGVKLFNLIIGVFTAFILYRLTALLQIRRNEIIVIILFFIPVYATMLMSGMTEVLFAAVLIFSSYLFLRGDFIWSALVISFLPLIRTEGIVIWPWFMVAFLLHRKWTSLPFIFTASILYSFIGGFYFKDFLWLYTHIPYTGTYDIYGHGELLHFVRSNKAVFGIPVTILFLLGIIATFWREKKIPTRKELSKTIVRDEVLVVLAPLLTYYMAHSYVWWQGINSLGLIRVMAGVAPLVAIYGLRGFNFLIDNIELRFLRTITAAAFLLLIVVTPFKVYQIPMKPTEKDKTVKMALEWFRSSPYNDRKYYVWDSYFYFVLGTDPYNSEKMGDGIPDRKNPENFVKPGEIVIWDAHFSAVDGRFPLSSIIDNPYYKLVKVIRPTKPFESGGGTYQLCFFERLDVPGCYNNKMLLDSFVSVMPQFQEKIFERRVFAGDFNPSGLKIKPNDEFLMLYEMPIDKKAWNEGDLLGIKLTSHGNQLILAVSVGNDREAKFYESYTLGNGDSISNSEYRILLPKVSGRKQKLKIYLWNKDKGEAFLQKFEIKLLRQ